MSTRGLYGIRKDGVDKLTYNHFDSYPSGLGKDIVKFCSQLSNEDLSRFFDSIVLVGEKDEPTKEQIEECVEEGLFDGSVSERSTKDWYCLLRGLMGNFAEYTRLLSEGKRIYMYDDHNFIKDSLFCEYAYIINLDENVLEFYIGFQHEPQPGNRYGTEKKDEYYPCKLVSSVQLDQLREKTVIRAFDPTSIVNIFEEAENPQ